MGVTPKWMVFLMGKSKTKMDETWRYPDDLGNLHLVLFQPTKGKRSFLPRFLDVFPNNGNPVFLVPMNSHEFILAGPGRDRYRRGLRSGHGLVGIPLVLIFHGDLMGILWDLTTQYITI